MNNQAGNNDLQVGISNRHILSIALPITLALLVPQVNFVTNNIFLSGLGETALGTAGITGVCYLVFALIGNGLNSGVQSIISRRAGEQRPEEIGKVFGQSIRISLIFSAICILLVYLFGSTVLRMVLVSPQVEISTISFLQIRIWGLPFLFLFLLGNALLVGTNNSSLLKFAFLIEALVNIFLDYTLIYGKLGFPEIGFNGAAYASIIAEACGVLAIALIIYYKRFHKRFQLFLHLKFSAAYVRLIVKQSLPLVLQFLLSVVAWLIFYILIENTGEHQLAISTTMRNIFGIFGVFAWAFASTTNAMVSNIIGQGKKDLVRQLIKRIMVLSIVFTTALCLLLNIFPSIFLDLFGRGDQFTTDAIPVIRMVSAGVILMSLATVWLNAVTGTGNTKVNLLIEVIAISLYAIYVWLIIVYWKLSLTWAWSSELVYWSILLFLSVWYISSDKWRNKVI